MKRNDIKASARKKVELINGLLEELLEKVYQGCPIATEKFCIGISSLVRNKVNSMIKLRPEIVKHSILERDDMLQISWLTCLNIVKKQPLKGKYFNLRALFRTAIQRAIADAINARSQSRQQYLPEEWDLAVDENFIEDMQIGYLRKLYKRFLPILTENEAYVIEEHFYHNRKITDIAYDLKYSRQRVNKIKNAALEKLRRAITQNTGAKGSKDLM